MANIHVIAGIARSLVGRVVRLNRNSRCLCYTLRVFFCLLRRTTALALGLGRFSCCGSLLLGGLHLDRIKQARGERGMF